MNVASKELCQELYDLSGWKNVSQRWVKGDFTHEWTVRKTRYGYNVIPAYDLGYLLRKLPTDRSVSFRLSYKTNEWWLNEDIDHRFITADNPEGAAAKLAIELFKQGILKREAA